MTLEKEPKLGILTNTSEIQQAKKNITISIHMTSREHFVCLNRKPTYELLPAQAVEEVKF